MHSQHHIAGTLLRQARRRRMSQHGLPDLIQRVSVERLL
jgi:hypothetical protein